MMPGRFRYNQPYPPRHHRPCAGDLDSKKRRVSMCRDGRARPGHDIEVNDKPSAPRIPCPAIRAARD